MAHPNSTATQDPSADDTVSVRARDLVVGRTLQFPLYDSAGVLLLAEGNEITPKFKSQLARRRVDRVELRHEDYRQVTVCGLAESTVGQDDGRIVSLHPELVKPLDEIVDSGALFVANSGLPVRDRLKLHECFVYDEAFREQLSVEFRENAASLDELMRASLDARPCSGDDLVAMAARYVSHFTEDADCVTALATATGGDPGISSHSLRMAILGMGIGIEMGLDERNVCELGLGGLLHDWGMAQVPAELRDSERVLSPVEFLQIKKHPIHTLEMLQRVVDLPAIVPLTCYQVHEQPNGKGYPRGRSGNAIHLFARILKVADVFSGMVERRPHRPPFSAYSAMECLVRLSHENVVDVRVVRSLLHLTALFPIGSHVRLTDGRMARVLRRNFDAYNEPIVQIVADAEGERISEGEVIDLTDSELKVEQALPTPGTDEVLIEPEQIHVDRR